MKGNGPRFSLLSAAKTRRVERNEQNPTTTYSVYAHPREECASRFEELCRDQRQLVILDVDRDACEVRDLVGDVLRVVFDPAEQG